MLSPKTEKIVCLAGIAMISFCLNVTELPAAEDNFKLPRLSLYEKTAPRLSLNPVQQIKFKKIIKSYKTNRIRLTARLKVAEVEFSELIENQTFDLTEIKAQVNLISGLKKKVAENFVAHLVKTKSLLTDEQVSLFKHLTQDKP